MPIVLASGYNLQLTNMSVEIIGFGSPANWVCGIFGALGHYSHHRHRNKPSSELWSCCNIQ